MSSRHEALAEKLVSTFEANLDAGQRAAIQGAAREELLRLVREALSVELAYAAGRMEALLRELRADLERRELEL
jgi:hypothetical protein